MSNQELQATLYAIFRLSRDNLHIDASSIGRVVGISTSGVALALIELDRLGLVDASRARLTMPGLVIAVSSSAGLSGSRLDLSTARQEQSRVCSQSIPIAAQQASNQKRQPGDIASSATQ
jgi:hypothetical protein